MPPPPQGNGRISTPGGGVRRNRSAGIAKLVWTSEKATVASVFLAGTGWGQVVPEEDGLGGLLKILPQGWPFAVPLLLILLVHEFGHYFAARLHHVEASLPFFIPMPVLSPFGTMGAVISMKGRIKSRNALLDIGASGPLAGLVIAIPVLVIGLMSSEVKPITGSGIQEGQSLLYLLMKRIVVGPIPPGHDVFLSPTALAGWTGLFVTSLNLIPIGQLDGGHIAYAVFGRRARYVSAITLVTTLLLTLGSLSWILIAVIMLMMAFFLGLRHPHIPDEGRPLDGHRKLVALFAAVMFILCFTPVPIEMFFGQ